MIRPTFDTFTISNENRDAFEACLAAARGQCAFPMPLVIAGPVNAGKTHLLQAVAAYIHANRPDCPVYFAAYPQEVAAIERNTSNPKGCLIVDGIDRLAQSEAPIEVVLERFLRLGNSVVASIRRPPTRTPGRTPGMHAMFNGGTVIEMDRPPALLPATGRMTQQLAQLSKEFESLRQERDRLSAELEQRHEQGTRVRSLQIELDETLADHARMQGRVAALRELEEARDIAIAERDAARAEAQSMRQAAEQWCERIAERETQWLRRYQDLAGRIAPGLTGGADKEWADWERMTAEARAAEGRMRVDLSAAQGRIAALEEELRRAYRQLAARTAEMEATRFAAASQVAASLHPQPEADTPAENGPVLFDLNEYLATPSDFDASRPLPPRAANPVYDPKLRDVIEEAFRTPENRG